MTNSHAPSTSLRQRVGASGEAHALRFVRERGYRVLAVDWRCRIGQIDIVAEDGETIVIIEVKTRSSEAFGSGLEAIDKRKQRKLRQLSAAFQANHYVTEQSCRIDALALIVDGDLAVQSCDYVCNAVEAEDF